MEKLLMLRKSISDAVEPIIMPVVGKSRTHTWISAFEDHGPYTFPEYFLWGASSGAEQVESQQPTDWAAFQARAVDKGRTRVPALGRTFPGHIQGLDAYAEDVRFHKNHFEQYYPEDLAMARRLAHNAFRFSISWARLFPQKGMKSPDPAGIAFYRGLLDTLTELGLTPFVTLFHFSAPKWFWEPKNQMRGWERPDALDHFERFVRSVVRAFGEDIRHWCTLNEPMSYIYNGYVDGIFPPLEQRQTSEAVAPVVQRLLEAHALAYRIVKEDGRARGKVNVAGIAKHIRHVEPWRNLAPLDRITAALVDQAFNWDFLDAIQTGVLKIADAGYLREIPGLKGSQDFIGINYQGKSYVETNLLDPDNPGIHAHDPKNEDEVVSDNGWTVCPQGFYEVLTEAHKRYGLAVYVLENGIAEGKIHDVRRQKFLVTHIKEMWNAMAYGNVDVRGYFHRCLLDGFEWNDGFEARYGLVKVDYENDCQRIVRPSAKLFARIIAANALDPEIWDAYQKK